MRKAKGKHTKKTPSKVKIYQEAIPIVRCVVCSLCSDPLSKKFGLDWIEWNGYWYHTKDCYAKRLLKSSYTCSACAKTYDDHMTAYVDCATSIFGYECSSKFCPKCVPYVHEGRYYCFRCTTERPKPKFVTVEENKFIDKLIRKSLGLRHGIETTTYEEPEMLHWPYCFCTDELKEGEIIKKLVS